MPIWSRFCAVPEAHDLIRKHLPNRIVEQVNTNGIAGEGRLLNCISWVIAVNDQVDLVAIAGPEGIEIRPPVFVIFPLDQLGHHVIFEKWAIQDTLFPFLPALDSGKQGGQTRVVKIDLRTFNQTLAQVFMVRI